MAVSPIDRRHFVLEGTGLLALGLAGRSASSAPLLAQDAALATRLDKVITQAISGQRLVGAVVMVARDGQCVYRRAAGMADREQGRIMREDAIFRLASLTKPIVTATALRLVEHGLLRLDAPVTRWLPWFTPQLADGSVPTITLRHLLTHTSGLSYTLFQGPDSDYAAQGVSDGLDIVPGLTLEEDVRRLARTRLLFAPGKGWHYGLSLDVAGAVIAAATQRPLPEVVRDLVLAPLGMRDSGFVTAPGPRLTAAYTDGHPPLRITPLVPVPFGSAFIHLTPERATDASSFPSGGGGMVGTVPDFMRFLMAMQAGGAPILSRETVAMMMRDSVGAQAQTQGPGWGFGLGGAVLDDPGAAGTPQAAGCWQWGGAYGHIWFVDRARGLCVAALTNTTPEGMSGPFTQALRDAVYGHA